MNLKRYSDFEHSEEKTTPTEVKSVIKSVDNPIEIPLKEEVLLTPKETSNIEILEEKIIKFNTGNIKDILETIKSKYSDTDYYIRKINNQLHIVKYNENLKLNVNEFVNMLLKYYSSKTEFNKITEGIKVKGNQNFCIVENMKDQYGGKFINDLTSLLAKKNKE